MRVFAHQAFALTPANVLTPFTYVQILSAAIFGLLAFHDIPDWWTITGIALILLLAISLPATINYVLFVKREHTAYLRIPLDYLYSIYVIFAVACIVKHGRLVWHAARGTHLAELAPAGHGDGP